MDDDAKLGCGCVIVVLTMLGIIGAVGGLFTGDFKVMSVGIAFLFPYLLSVLGKRQEEKEEKEKRERNEKLAQAALNGDTEAQYELGRNLVNRGYESEGVSYLQKAADKGHEEARRFLEDYRAKIQLEEKTRRVDDLAGKL